jgi:predicted alpha/beta hydrolase family esterase
MRIERFITQPARRKVQDVFVQEIRRQIMTTTEAITASKPLRSRTRLLIIPGLRDSGHGHWQSWLQEQYPDALRVVQDDWTLPDLDAWARRIGETIAMASPAHRPDDTSPTRWIAVAHSFGCLALARYLKGDVEDSRDQSIASALMVAPADPVKFDVTAKLPQQGLGIPLNLVGSENDPWMTLEHARTWAQRWRAGFLNLGPVGHINTESGFGPWPMARHQVDRMLQSRH